MTTSLLRRNRGARTPEAQPRFQLPKGDWQGELYPRRIPPLPRGQQRMFQRFFLAVIRRSAREKYDYNCFLVTARLGRIFPIHAMLVRQLLRGGAISPPDTERVIIRIAWRMGCQYEYAHHTRMAFDHGISRREIESLTNDDDPEWSDRTRTLLMAADELFATKNLSAPTYQRLRRELDENQILEFSMLVGHYVMAAMMLDVADVTVRLDDAGSADDLARAASDVDIVIDYLWGPPTAGAMAAIVVNRADPGKPLTWIEIGSVAGCAAAIPSAALRAARLQIVGSGQGSVPTRDILAELPAIAAEIAGGVFRIDARPVPLADVEAAWKKIGATDRIVITP